MLILNRSSRSAGHPTRSIGGGGGMSGRGVGGLRSHGEHARNSDNHCQYGQYRPPGTTSKQMHSGNPFSKATRTLTGSIHPSTIGQSGADLSTV